MLVIPAIDIKEGRCVRLRQGKMSEETIFSDHPEEMAKKWFDAGAQRLHLVDLDGAVQGRPVNLEAIRRIVKSAPIPVELGGGVRDMTTMTAYLELGIQYVILGTVAWKHPEFVAAACKAFPGRIILGIDAKDGVVALEGWTENAPLGPVELAGKFEKEDLAAIIYTDIRRDGMRSGCNVEATKSLALSVDVPVIASGGISGLADVLEILPLAEHGVVGMITGRALYDGSLDLKEAIEVCTAGRP
ncbi:MAG: 1-(5-phosphoribosyl)-5-[(5-phosphoribosylamino)methylideneamino]imidazole-4-carboxamide isomerase [Gammaproteobacteria bacterium]